MECPTKVEGMAPDSSIQFIQEVKLYGATVLISIVEVWTLVL
jgi:hypothetical protein